MSRIAIPYWKFIVICLCWWMFWLLLQAAIMHNIGFEWSISLADSTLSMILLAISGYTIGNMLRFHQPGTNNAFYLLAWCLGLALISTRLLQWCMIYFFHLNEECLAFINSSILIRFAFALLMIMFIAMSNWQWYYMRTQQENEARNADAEKLAKEAELSKLRQQLQPHFLFNSLNSISALAGTRPEEARKMIQQLSDFLRGTLKKDEQQPVKLAEEFEHLQLYLDIEKVRFGHRLKTIIEIDEESLAMSLPPLLLQPIVENAIKFGLYDTIGDTTIKISAKAESAQLVITIANPFDPTTASPRQGTGFGLNSVQRRLYLLYARNDLLSVQQNENIFTTLVKIPQGL